MGSLVWNGGSGNWNDPANWTVVSGSDTVPEGIDNVTINAPGSYEIDVTDAETVHNLTLTNFDAALNVTGTLAVTGEVFNQAATIGVLTGGTLEGGTVALTGGSALALTGGTLQSTTILANNGGATVQDGMLDNVTWQGAMPVTGTTDVVGGFNLENGVLGPVALDLTSGTLNFLDTETVDNATINYLGVINTSNVPFSAVPGAAFTLGPHVTMTSSGADQAIISVPGTLFNEGTMSAPELPGSLLINGPFQNDGTVNVPYSLEVAGDLINNGVVGPLKFFSSLVVDGNVLGSGTILLSAIGLLPSGTFDVKGTIEANEHIVGPLGGVFTVQATTIETGVTIENFARGSTVDLTGNPFIPGTTSVNYVDGLITVMQGSKIVDLFDLPGLPNNASFAVKPDGATGPDPGTEVVTSTKAACFASGTRIRTERGEVAVEELRVGDMVPVVRAGGMLPIIWIGRRRVRIDRHPRPSEVQPVRVSAGAFADFVPMRDLWLSPEHAVFLHGVLVPVRHLVNGSTIVQVPLAEVTYWHVELPSHDLLLCEGAWTESYLDMGNRSAFENCDEPVALHPDFSRESWEARACQQQERGGPVVEAIRTAINARAAARAEAA